MARFYEAPRTCTFCASSGQRACSRECRDLRHRQLGEQRFVVLNQLAEDPRQGEVVGVDLDQTGDEDQVGTKGQELLADAFDRMGMTYEDRVNGTLRRGFRFAECARRLLFTREFVTKRSTIEPDSPDCVSLSALPSLGSSTACRS